MAVEVTWTYDGAGTVTAHYSGVTTPFVDLFVAGQPGDDAQSATGPGGSGDITQTDCGSGFDAGMEMDATLFSCSPTIPDCTSLVAIAPVMAFVYGTPFDNQPAPRDPNRYPGPRDLYLAWGPVIEFFNPQPLDVEMELMDEGVEQTNRNPGISAGGPTERV